MQQTFSWASQVKLLLDESIPRQLSRFFPDNYEVYTVQQMGWAGSKNGELLELARVHRFSALITVDRGFEFQQNIQLLPVPVVIMVAPSIHLEELCKLVPKVVSALSNDPKPDLYRISM